VINPIIPTTKTSRHPSHWLAGITRWLASLAETAGDRLFARDDQIARGHGWQVIALTGGLRRRYRDPRFDTLSECPECEGGGYVGGEPCSSCQATGRVTRELPAAGEVVPGDEDALAATA
jgi:hypothetical protein